MASLEATGRAREPKNSVHVDNNWKQRIETEEQTESQWKKNWGFLDSSAGTAEAFAQPSRAMKNFSHAQLAEESAKLSSTYAFTVGTKQDRHDARSADFAHAGSASAAAAAAATCRTAAIKPWYEENDGKRSTIRLNQLRQTSVPGSAVGAGLSAGSGAGAGALPPNAQMQPLSSTRQWDRYWAQDSALAAAAPGSAVRVGRLDTALATSMQPRILQAVGANLVTPGVDPQRKYCYPQTANQEVGWAWGGRRSLELFGVSGHGKRNMKWQQ